MAELTIDESGEVVSGQVYRCTIKNAAKLNYEEVGNWLDGKTPLPEKSKMFLASTEQLRLQNSPPIVSCSCAKEMAH